MVTKKWPKKIVSGLPPFAYPLLRHVDAWFAWIAWEFSNWTPFSANRVSGHYKNANCSLESIRAHRSNVMKIGFFFFFSANRFARINSRETPRFALQFARPSKSLYFEGGRTSKKSFCNLFLAEPNHVIALYLSVCAKPFETQIAPNCPKSQISQKTQELNIPTELLIAPQNPKLQWIPPELSELPLNFPNSRHFNLLKTTSIPNKNGSYGIKVGLHMP